jgi:hypothetical protein
VALAAAAILAFEVAPKSGIGLAIVVATWVLSMVLSEISWLLSPKLWRELATVRFWIVLVGLVLVGFATAKLR